MKIYCALLHSGGILAMIELQYRLIGRWMKIYCQDFFQLSRVTSL
jgi:hypothetical protein